jgi:hypothetical protein
MIDNFLSLLKHPLLAEKVSRLSKLYSIQTSTTKMGNYWACQKRAAPRAAPPAPLPGQGAGQAPARGSSPRPKKTAEGHRKRDITKGENHFWEGHHQGEGEGEIDPDETSEFWEEVEVDEENNSGETEESEQGKGEKPAPHPKAEWEAPSAGKKKKGKKKGRKPNSSSERVPQVNKEGKGKKRASASGSESGTKFMQVNPYGPDGSESSGKADPSSGSGVPNNHIEPESSSESDLQEVNPDQIYASSGKGVPKGFLPFLVRKTQFRGMSLGELLQCLWSKFAPLRDLTDPLNFPKEVTTLEEMREFDELVDQYGFPHHNHNEAVLYNDVLLSLERLLTKIVHKKHLALCKTSSAGSFWNGEGDYLARVTSLKISEYEQFKMTLAALVKLLQSEEKHSLREMWEILSDQIALCQIVLKFGGMKINSQDVHSQALIPGHQTYYFDGLHRSEDLLRKASGSKASSKFTLVSSNGDRMPGIPGAGSRKRTKDAMSTTDSDEELRLLNLPTSQKHAEALRVEARKEKKVQEKEAKRLAALNVAHLQPVANREASFHVTKKRWKQLLSPTLQEYVWSHAYHPDLKIQSVKIRSGPEGPDLGTLKWHKGKITLCPTKSNATALMEQVRVLLPHILDEEEGKRLRGEQTVWDQEGFHQHASQRGSSRANFGPAGAFPGDPERETDFGDSSEESEFEIPLEVHQAFVAAQKHKYEAALEAQCHALKRDSAPPAVGGHLPGVTGLRRASQPALPSRSINLTSSSAGETSATPQTSASQHWAGLGAQPFRTAPVIAQPSTLIPQCESDGEDEGGFSLSRPVVSAPPSGIDSIPSHSGTELSLAGRYNADGVCENFDTYASTGDKKVLRAALLKVSLILQRPDDMEGKGRIMQAVRIQHNISAPDGVIPSLRLIILRLRNKKGLHEGGIASPPPMKFKHDIDYPSLILVVVVYGRNWGFQHTIAALWERFGEIKDANPDSWLGLQYTSQLTSLANMGYENHPGVLVIVRNMEDLFRRKGKLAAQGVVTFSTKDFASFKVGFEETVKAGWGDSAADSVQKAMFELTEGETIYRKNLGRLQDVGHFLREDPYTKLLIFGLSVPELERLEDQDAWKPRARKNPNLNPPVAPHLRLGDGAGIGIPPVGKGEGKARLGSKPKPGRKPQVVDDEDWDEQREALKDPEHAELLKVFEQARDKLRTLPEWSWNSTCLQEFNAGQDRFRLYVCAHKDPEDDDPSLGRTYACIGVQDTQGGSPLPPDFRLLKAKEQCHSCMGAKLGVCALPGFCNKSHDRHEEGVEKAIESRLKVPKEEVAKAYRAQYERFIARPEKTFDGLRAHGSYEAACAAANAQRAARPLNPNLMRVTGCRGCQTRDVLKFEA